MNRWIYSACIMLLYSCCSSIREKAELNQRNRGVETGTLSMENTNSSDENFSFSESEQNAVQHILEIRPKGIFSFTPYGGFKGEATYIKIKQQSKSTKTQATKNRIIQTEQRKATDKLSVKRNNSVKVKELKNKNPLFNTFNLFVLLVGFLLLLYLAFKLSGRFKK